MLIAVFCGSNYVKAFKFRITIEHLWQNDTVPDGVEIVELKTGKSKHGKVNFSKEAVKMCAAAISQHFLTEADKNNFLELPETSAKCDDVAKYPTSKGV